ncbi:5-formyltetrahydrofolate cyclo-ligase [soil metagenome]
MVEPTIASAPGDETTDKTLLRRRLLAERRAIAPALRHEWEAAIAERLVPAILELSPRRVAVYWPIAGEPDLRSTWTRLEADGVELALPVVLAAATPLAFRRWTTGMTLQPDAAKVPAPPAGAAVAIDLVVIPCLGLHPDGYRLGYGAGFFDRTMAAIDRPLVSIGVAFDIQRCRFGIDVHDEPLTLAVTPSRIERFA